MPEALYTTAALLAVVAVVAWISERVRLPMPILLVIAGIALALLPGVPSIELDAEFVMLGLLPPLIYFAAFTMSWQAFREHLRPTPAADKKQVDDRVRFGGRSVGGRSERSGPPGRPVSVSRTGAKRKRNGVSHFNPTRG